MTTPRGQHGLTLVEVIIALAIVAVIATILMTTVASSFRIDRASGERTQAAQYLNYLGRRISGGHRAALPDVAESSVAWAYGELPAAFDDLTAKGGFADPDRYRASVSIDGDVSLPSASVVHYVIDVCWRGSDGEHCVTGHTGGPPPAASDAPPPLPGLN